MRILHINKHNLRYVYIYFWNWCQCSVNKKDWTPYYSFCTEALIRKRAEPAAEEAITFDFMD
jgi:hypothetical protein